jgi:hypothetical protein
MMGEIQVGEGRGAFIMDAGGEDGIGKGTSVEMTVFLGADFIVSPDHRQQVIEALEQVLVVEGGVAGLFLQAIAWKQGRSNGRMPIVNQFIKLHKLDGSVDTQEK